MFVFLRGFPACVSRAEWGGVGWVIGKSVRNWANGFGDARWDEGLLDMCPGDKRKLTIPPEYGYGDQDMGPIKAGSTLSEWLPFD